MILRGYRVVYLQPIKEVLSINEPTWLGKAIAQACQVIEDDQAKNSSAVSALVGVSLGSYLGLNITLNVPMEKFVIVAGGVPLSQVFSTNKIFRLDRAEVESSGGGKKLKQYWEPYDEAFKKADLRKLSALFINSHNDHIIPDEKLAAFLESYKQTGAKVLNYHKGNLTHVLQVLSINFRIRQIHNFINKS